jgi:hypothetical protein
MKNSGLVVLMVVALLLGFTACQNRPFLTGSIYEDQSLFVRLAVDQTVGGGHSHPASMTAEKMATVLSGLMVEEPGSLMPSVPFPGKDKEPPRHPAFRMEEIALLAPLLAKGLNTARPEEVVTFYWITQQPAPIEHVTSGGVFIDGDHLHFLLSNYRSPTRYPPDAETMRYVDGRSTPLQSIAPQETILGFHQTSALIPPEQGFLKNPFRAKRREIVVLLSKLAEESTSTTQESH